MFQLLVLILTPGLFGNADGLFRRACEDDYLTISCGSNKVIQVESASYGRTRRGLCARGGTDDNTFCYSPSSMRVTKHRCEGQPACTVYAANSVFGDPCYEVKKYLEVSYNCVPKGPCHSTLLQVCEFSLLTIQCHYGKKIKILSANYGRTTGAEVCGGQPIKTTNCGAAGALGKVRGVCQGRSRCAIHAGNSVFGDPCWGTYKYLEVRYRCEW